MLTMAVPANNM